ncbi:MarR family winged helix-turn-helix transcriptional regulator [Loigolactobacillus jiayinensis]|uniref:MarR family winged helix-turn-helix transcriptional regulator n=1 Tax=Loigolactobacillus jiayinensis TaxID=2486016 RepID=A0ABW1RKY1_9LACO|nr:MarR family transcriptional regulator [Loigolactobacillus jiayinensis]
MTAKTSQSQSLGEMFFNLSQAITQNRSLEEFNLTRLQAMTLSKVYQHPGVSMSQLATNTGISRAQLTRLITTLETRQLVQRKHNQTNRRIVNVYGTPKGQTVIAKHMQLIQDRIDAHVQTLPPEEQAALSTHLHESMRLMIKAKIIDPDTKMSLFKG